jgi:hypothetical protein
MMAILVHLGTFQVELLQGCCLHQEVSKNVFQHEEHLRTHGPVIVF